jgi:hypothetical protein
MAAADGPVVYVRPMRGRRADDDPAFKGMPPECIINTCSTGSDPVLRRDLSPFFLGPCVLSDGRTAKNVENAWQFSKVYAAHADADGEPTDEWYGWARAGMGDNKAHRFPMGRGAKPLYAYGGRTAGDDDDRAVRWGYVESRYRIYAPLYAEAVVGTEGYARVERLLREHGKVTLLDFDGWDNEKVGLALTEVFYYPWRKMGHAFVLAMLLTDQQVWTKEFDPHREAAVCRKLGRQPMGTPTTGGKRGPHADASAGAAGKRPRA